MTAGATVLRERREAATAAIDAHREAVEGGYRVRTVYVPNRRVQIRVYGRCPFGDCAGTYFELERTLADLFRPHVASRGSVICMLCSREVARLEIGGAS